MPEKEENQKGILVENLANTKQKMIDKLAEMKTTYNQSIVHSKGQEFKEEYFKGFEHGANFIIELLFGNE